MSPKNDAHHKWKPSSGEDVMTMTIEFLRARLLSERAASKTAKQQVQQLNEKVMELEEILEQMVDQRQKAERAAEDAILKLKIAGICTESSTDAAGMPQAVESLDPVFGVQSRAAAIPQAQGAEVLDVCCTPQKLLETSDCLTQSQESRAATEDRLRNMWNQINKEITVLTEERSKEDRVCAELITWMCQVPAIIQEVLATTAGTPSQNIESANINGHVIGPNSKIGDEHSSLEIEDAPILLEEHQKEVDTSRIDVQNNGVQIKGTQNQYNPHCLSSGELQDTPGEGLGRGQLKLLGEEGTIHNPQVQSGTTPNFLSEQLLSNKQREGNTRGSQMEEIPGHFHHRRSYSSNSCLQGGEDFGIASQHLEYDGPRRKSQGSYFAGKQNHHPQPPKHPEGESVDRNGFSNGEPLLSLGYGPGYDAPKELASPVTQLCMDTRSRSATDILQALQRVKQSIQVSSCPKNVLNTGMKEYNRYGEGDPSLHLRSVYEGEATAPLKNHHLRQAPANPSLQERLSHNNNWHKKQYSGPRSNNQQQHLGGGGSRAPRVLQSSDSPSIGVMSYNNDLYRHTLVGQHGIITRSSSLDHQHQHHHSSHNSHSKFNLIPSANRQSKYVDKLNDGRGIQFYFS
ncbi:unnamed protein product [Sphagnum troendelagicum]|uniref:Uncharacterized protein n=1 Tax=Sphagnum troendelagicum TaxID=128251 RepID=A0ABP0UIM0_9BRYO